MKYVESSIKNHNKEVIEASIYYQRKKRDDQIKRARDHSEKVTAVGMRYLSRKKNLTEEQANKVMEKISKEYRGN